MDKKKFKKGLIEFEEKSIKNNSSIKFLEKQARKPLYKGKGRRYTF